MSVNGDNWRNVLKVFVTALVMVVIGVGGVIPILAEEAAAQAGILGTVLDLIPVFVALLVLLVVARPLLQRT